MPLLFAYAIIEFYHDVAHINQLKHILLIRTYLATLRRFLRLIFPELSSSNSLKAFKISSCGSLSNIMSVTETLIIIRLKIARSATEAN